MPILKRATAQLRAAGIPTLEIHRGLWGYTCYDPKLRNQTSHTYKTAEQSVQATIDGERPTEGAFDDRP